MITRRDLLIGSTSLGMALATRLPIVSEKWLDLPPAVSSLRLGRPRFSSYPFTLGIASGDPVSDGVVLWTRLAPDPIRGGGMPTENFEVHWEVASDERMSRVVQKGTATAGPELGHSVHVQVEGLEPDRWYWYQFKVGGEYSPVGKTRTTPVLGSMTERLRFGFASCNHYEQGYFTAFRHMAEEDFDLAFHLGDYIYEYEGRADRVRMHSGPELESLADYRNRYALYKTDSDLQAAHAAFPWVVTWDDHEVDNNYAAAVSENEDPVAWFLRRRANAYQAYYEHMPLRLSAMPNGPDMRLYRQGSYSQLVSFFVLDTRQYRSDQPCNDEYGPRCPQVFGADMTMMGLDQERWLFDALDRSTARWNVIPQQVMVAPVAHPGPDGESYSMDQWSGYDYARSRLITFLADRQPSNPVVLTGDIHENWANDLKSDFRDPSSATVGTELVGTSISSGGDGSDTSDRTNETLAENFFVKFFNSQRGYVRCEVTAEALQADYRVVPHVTLPDAPIMTRASFLIEDGRPGVQRL